MIDSAARSPPPSVAMSSTLHRWVIALSVIVPVGLSVAFFVHAALYPSCCDARQYVEMAQYYESHGLLPSPYAPHSDVRTYGYPWFLSLLSRVTRPLGLPMSTAVFLAQLLLYFASAAFLASRISRSFGRAAGTVVFCGLAWNILLLPYLALAMTDGFSVVLLLAAACLLVYLLTTPLRVRTIGLSAALLGAIVGFAVVVRPANLWFFALVVIGAIAVIRAPRPNIAEASRLRQTLAALLFAGVAVIFALAMMGPQSALNWVRAGQVSPLPIYDLKSLQIDLGLKNIKYATRMIEKPAGIYYRNPLYPATAERRGLEWYFQEPLSGMGTVALRMFAGFDFDYLFPYIYDPEPPYRPLLFVISQLIVFFGFGGALLL
ncbi:MAG: hypothetical protein ACRDGM_04705, partial [bacterium]